MELWIILLIVLLAVVVITSIMAVFITIKDKKSAGSGKWRVKESTLLIVSAIGGSVAMLATMLAIRHKTKHKKFMVGIPIIIIIQVALLIGAGLLYWFLG